MKNQALFSSKDKSKKIKMSSAAIFVWHFLRVNKSFYNIHVQSLQSKAMITTCWYDVALFCYIIWDRL